MKEDGTLFNSSDWQPVEFSSEFIVYDSNSYLEYNSETRTLEITIDGNLQIEERDFVLHNDMMRYGMSERYRLGNNGVYTGFFPVYVGDKEYLLPLYEESKSSKIEGHSWRCSYCGTLHDADTIKCWDGVSGCQASR